MNKLLLSKKPLYFREGVKETPNVVLEGAKLG